MPIVFLISRIRDTYEGPTKRVLRSHILMQAYFEKNQRVYFVPMHKMGAYNTAAVDDNHASTEPQCLSGSVLQNSKN